jgi:prepilin-type N-terminal cleavage/methylation domain-containing protein
VSGAAPTAAVSAARGFTLVELLVALALLAALLGLAFGAVRHYGGLLERLQVAQGRFDQAREFAALREALRASYLWLEPRRRGALARRDGGGYEPYFEGRARELRLVTGRALLHRPQEEPYALRIADPGEGITLWERPLYHRSLDYRLPEAGERNWWEEEPAVVTLRLEGGWSLERIEYYDGIRWRGEMVGRLPVALRMAVAREGHREEWFFSLAGEDDERWRRWQGTHEPAG